MVSEALFSSDAQDYADYVRLLGGRVRFKGTASSAPFPSVIVAYFASSQIP